MFTDLLVGLAWIAIVLLPAIVASRQPGLSHDGYLDPYMNSSDEGVDGAEQADSAANE
jgi:hypothetical protein